MRELKTIQKNEKLNTVYAVDEPGCGGANHAYDIHMHPGVPKGYTVCVHLQFQEGPRNDPRSVTGLCDQDLLEIVRDRLQGFAAGILTTRDTAVALRKVEEALMWLNKRTEDRIDRGVLGTMEK